MSFSAQVKEELTGIVPKARHCQLAELSAFLLLLGKVEESEGRITVSIRSENSHLLRKCFTILEKAFNIGNIDAISQNQEILITDQNDVIRILQALKLWQENTLVKRENADSRLLILDCCKRAFVRGCFLAAGSISTPEKFYHLEFVCGQKESAAKQICQMLTAFGIEAGRVFRRQQVVVYLKEGDQISDTLNLIEAHESLMEFENVRILKDVRNRVNRKVNCEAANLQKTAYAAAEQIECIGRIREAGGLDSLPQSLKDAAIARLEMPEASLEELGKRMDPPIGKSGMNHRLRKLKEIAEAIPN